jgi:peptide-methionine (R)-S-oxide reductase
MNDLMILHERVLTLNESLGDALLQMIVSTHSSCFTRGRNDPILYVFYICDYIDLQSNTTITTMVYSIASSILSRSAATRGRFSQQLSNTSLSTSHRTTTSSQQRRTTRLMAHSSGSQDFISLDKNTPEEVWKNRLTAQEYHVLRQKGTEAPGTGEYNGFKAPPEGGVFVCRACNAPLYDSSTKFNSGCGWPAFYDELPGTVERHVDNSMGMRRVEITCKNCGGHLGHVFEGEGFPTPTDERHCVNSLSIRFVKN